MSRTTTFRNQSYSVVAYPLRQIIGTDNCRRPCPILWNLGLDAWDAYRKITSGDIALVREGVSVLEQSPRFVSMAKSIEDNGQLQAIGLRSYRARTGRKIMVEEPVKGGAEGEVQMVEKDEFEDRAALSYGNGRLFGTILREGRRLVALADGQKASRTPVAVDAILMRLTVEQSYELSVEENDRREQMDDLDWGLVFDRMLKTVNPATDRPYTIKDVAEKWGKNYHWVRGRAALPYLPAEELKLITDWNKVNIDALCQRALRFKAGAKQTTPVDQGEGDPLPAPAPARHTGGMPQEDGDDKQVTTGAVEGNASSRVQGMVEPTGGALPVEVQPKKRRTPMTLADMARLFAQTEEVVARQAIAACMQMTMDEAVSYAREVAEKDSKKK